MMHWKRHSGPLGELLLVASERGICGLYFHEHRHFKGLEGPGYLEHDGHPLLIAAALQLDEYFDGKRQRFSLPLDLQGTAFQKEVWDGLRDLDFGQTRHYGEHARRIGHPAAVRAVGAAIGRNPVCVILPCHRVLAASGELTGYAGGLERKRMLLALERRVLAQHDEEAVHP